MPRRQGVGGRDNSRGVEPHGKHEVWRLRAAGLADGPGRDRRSGRAVRGDDRRGQGGRRRPWESIWVYDHFHTIPQPTMETTFECWTITATLARDTERVRIGQMVGCNGYRNPALYAKIASTVDVASHGRLDAGIGAGWYEHEWRAYGYGFPETPRPDARLPRGGSDHSQDVVRIGAFPDLTEAGSYGSPTPVISGSSGSQNSGLIADSISQRGLWPFGQTDIRTPNASSQPRRSVYPSESVYPEPH